MWDHAATRANVETLRARGARVVNVEEGELACGYGGRGRMASPETIMAVIEEALEETTR
jgi:phosphopantothenoylcysteine decarboxylase/phosphopantothenate--cysteine ligase